MFRTKEQIEEAVFEIAESALREIGGYVLDVTLRGARGSRVMVITADTEMGITLDELTEMSKEIEGKLDETDYLTEHYTLEVTSPGLDWPLKDARDFRRRSGKKVRVEHTLLEPASPIEGTIENVSEETVTIETEKEGELAIPFDQIVQGNLVLEW